MLAVDRIRAEGPSQLPFKVESYKSEGRDLKRIEAKVGDNHLRIFPHMFNNGMSGFEVHVFPDDGHGQADTSAEIDSAVVSGKLEDIEELGFRYTELLKTVGPDKIFADIEDANRAIMKEISGKQGQGSTK
jgi:hypothetical protein